MNFVENLLILFANRIIIYIELLYLRIDVLVKSSRLGGLRNEVSFCPADS